MEDSVARLLSVEIHNVKNVYSGKIDMAKNTMSDWFSQESDILGIYGQNGSGKTAVIQVLSLFKALMCGQPFWSDFRNWMSANKDKCSCSIKVAIKKDNVKKYIATYSWVISRNGFRENSPGLISEKLMVSKYNESGSWTKTTPFFNCTFSNESEQIFTPKYRYEKFIQGDQKKYIALSVALKMTQEKQTSLLFSNDFYEILKTSPENDFFEIVSTLRKYAWENIFTILNSHTGMISAGLIIPLAIVHKEQDTKAFGEFPIPLREPLTVDKRTFLLIDSVIKKIDSVIKTLVPGLSIETKRHGSELLKDGTEGIRFELISIRDGNSFPLRYESEGIQKIISILSAVIFMYNNPTALIAIDEFDAGIFEALLGSLLHVIEETGRGQLIFTSHNLRPLEVLKKDNIIFSTANANNRYIRMTNIRPTNNLRDCYIRALSIEDQPEKLAEETRESEIRRALRKAGENG